MKQVLKICFIFSIFSLRGFAMYSDYEFIDKAINTINNMGVFIEIIPGFTEEHLLALEKQINQENKNGEIFRLPPSYVYFLKKYGYINYPPFEFEGMGIGQDSEAMPPSRVVSEISGKEISGTGVGALADELWHDYGIPRHFLPVLREPDWCYCIDLSQTDQDGESPVYLVDWDGNIDGGHFGNGKSYSEFVRKKFEHFILESAEDKARIKKR